MSYIITPSITTPVSIANGGTGGTTKASAMTSLTSAAFSTSSQLATWGSATSANSPAPDSGLNMAAINDLLATLRDLGVLGE